MVTSVIEAVKTGDIITVVYPAHKDRPQQETVKSPCSNPSGGQWYCATHKEFFLTITEALAKAEGK